MSTRVGWTFIRPILFHVNDYSCRNDTPFLQTVAIVKTWEALDCNDLLPYPRWLKNITIEVFSRIRSINWKNDEEIMQALEQKLQYSKATATVITASAPHEFLEGR